MDILDSGSLKIQYNRNRYYDYYTGRWLQRDTLGVNPAGGEENRFNILGPYEQGLSLYEYVRSNPVKGLDAIGLFGLGHGDITGKALDKVDLWHLPGGGPDVGCLLYIYSTLRKANTDQDLLGSLASGDLRRHYVRPNKKGETDADKRAADRAYMEYISTEQNNFWADLSKGTGGCDEALKALGRMDHSFQDFFGHAIRRDDGFDAWSEGMTGDPYDRDDFWPPSKKEHGWREPVRGAEKRKRKEAAINFSAQQLYGAGWFGKWWASCRDWCICYRIGATPR